MNLLDLQVSDWLLVLNLVVTCANLFVLAWIYFRISQSQIDDNIINATNSLLLLLEKVNKLESREQILLANWINDWEYVDVPKFIKKRGHHIPKPETIEQLRQYFIEMAAVSQTSRPSE